jgi:pimeloyl-ACP methyl ester carboxylesterase
VEGSGSILTQDGRSLAYAEYGLAGGKPVFFFHGMPGSRLFHPFDEITAGLGVRLICVDRPGYGGSSFQPGRQILDWARDIAGLADFLGFKKFSIAGHSGGGPYVAACAFALAERVTAAAILSGMGPVETPGAAEAMSAVNRFGFKAGRYLPWTLWILLVWLVYHGRCADPATAMNKESGHRPQADEEQFRLPGVRQVCLASEVEGFQQGLRGLAWDARLLTRPWGFPLEGIRVPVYIWHGSLDDQADSAMARYIAGKIPGSRFILCEGEAHLLLFPHWEEILVQLTSE